MLEIERKFLVSSQTYRKKAISKERIVQGFLNPHPERTVRVRIKGEKGFLTVKGKSNKAGTSRFEWEKEIGVDDVDALLPFCEAGVISKVRYEVPVGEHIFEVDEFDGDNEGLVVAEIELSSETEPFEIPDWVGKEVTGEVKYYNSQLGQNPYKNWKE